MWSDYYNDTYDKDFYNDKKFKKYLTDKEYRYIESFNEKYHPAFWGSHYFGFYTKTGQVWFYKQEFFQMIIYCGKLKGLKNMEIQ